MQSGTTLRPYEILSPVGAGGMGEVYKTRDTRLDRTVAIKMLLEREAETVSSLNQPHLCTLHDIGAQGGTNFLVMAHLDGRDP